MINDPSVCSRIWETIGAVFQYVVYVNPPALLAAVIVIELIAFGRHEGSQTLDHACDCSGCCSSGVCSISSSVGQAIGATTTLVVIFASVEHLLGNFTHVFQVCMVVFILAFGLKSPWM